ncbi:hypothetical protein [Anaerotalea alkaliphila]|uniref:Uncharacterized protein n=1 Tax=Anaerotalea alkaliphila TaxID=2662126 RepID=A0A7X5KMI4_9FIRM|nr:hypothetical protein [Anaerotalea alkaliphila]NDL67864.1 hypothetical protein [Anaerotalea alkaliphila]
MEELLDYIIALTNLYGLVHKDKVVEIYNRQHGKKVDPAAVDALLQDPTQELEEEFVGVFGEHFVSQPILEEGAFGEELRKRKGKPFHVPPREELLRYRDDFYFEETPEYEALAGWLGENLFGGDMQPAELLCEEIQTVCQFDFQVLDVLELFNQEKVRFKDQAQLEEAVGLVGKLADNTRLGENNGLTPRELRRLQERRMV